MPKAVIFDIDGTLIDSVDAHARAWVDAFREFGHSVTFEAVRSQIGKGGDQLLPVFLSPEAVAAEGEALSKRRGEILKERYLADIKAFPGVRALFERIRADGMRIVIASSAKADELATYERIAGIPDLVDLDVSSDDVEASKPEPDVFEAAMGKLPGVSRAQAIVVGDTPYDAEAAARAGLRAIGVLCGGFPEASLRQAGCIAIYQGPADLLARYDSSPLAPEQARGGPGDAPLRRGSTEG